MHPIRTMLTLTVLACLALVAGLSLGAPALRPW